MGTSSNNKKPGWEISIAEIVSVPWGATILSWIPQIAAHDFVRAVGLGSSDPARRSEFGNLFELVVATYVVLAATAIAIGTVRFFKWGNPTWGARCVWILPTIVFYKQFGDLARTTGKYQLNPYSELFGTDCGRTTCVYVMTTTMPMIAGLAYSLTVEGFGWRARARKTAISEQLPDQNGSSLTSN